MNKSFLILRVLKESRLFCYVCVDLNFRKKSMGIKIAYSLYYTWNKEKNKICVYFYGLNYIIQ